MIRFNVGSGRRNFGPEWVHLDGEPHAHVSDRLISLIYQPDNYIDLLYSSHLIGYFDRNEFANILEIWYNKIKPGGTLRLATPDFSVLAKFHTVGLDLDRLIGPLYGRMEMNENKIYHKTIYDEASLTKILTEAGFINIRRYDHAKTEHPNTGSRDDYFDDCSAAYINGTLISLNIECNKP